MISRQENFKGNEEHLKVLLEAIEKKNIKIWNYYREAIFDKKINLKGVILPGINLEGINLSLANLVGIDLSYAYLGGVNFQKANLKMADLRSAYLSKAVLIGANLSEANLSGAVLQWADLEEADLSGANLLGAILREANLKHTILSNATFSVAIQSFGINSYLDLATAVNLEHAIFKDKQSLIQYLTKAFEYMHTENCNEKTKWPEFYNFTLEKIYLLRKIFGGSKAPPAELIQVVQTITAELMKYLKKHPEELDKITPRQFEELIAEILSSYGWEVQLTPPTKDGGYDLFAISKDIAGVSTSWIIECKKYKLENKVGVDIVRALWGTKLRLQVANALLATTSHFTAGVHKLKASSYDLELKDYEGILEWINEYQPLPGGKLYIKDNKLVLPGE